MKKERILIDFDNITKEMKKAFLIAAKLREEIGVDCVCLAVNSRDNNHSSFGKYENIKLRCPDDGGCSACPGCGDLLHETIKKWSPFKEKRIPKKKNLKWKKTLSNLRGNHGNQDKSQDIPKGR